MIKINRDSSRHFGALIGMILLLIVALGFIFSIASCTTEKKASKYYYNNPKKGINLAVKIMNNPDSSTFGTNDSLASTYAANRYPCKDSVHTVVKYLPGKPQLVPGEKEFVYVDCDSLKKATGKNGKIKVFVPTYLEVDTSSIVSQIYQTDKAKYNSMYEGLSSQIRSQKDTNAKLSTQLKSATENAKKYKKYFIWSLAGLALVVLLSLLLRKLGF